METKTTPSWTRTKSTLTQNHSHSVRLMLREGRTMEVGLVIHGEEEWWKMADEGQGFFG